MVWEIDPVGTSCRLRVTHDQLGENADSELFGGWPMILSGLKTLLETGEDLDAPAPCATRTQPEADPQASAAYSGAGGPGIGVSSRGFMLCAIPRSRVSPLVAPG